MQPSFSHIYIERKVRDFSLTKLALSKFSDSNVIWVDHYKDIFNRSGQDFQSQKCSMNLILAKKTKPFLYPASDMVQNFDNPNIYYNTPVLNCIYNCDYCFLQGMYNSGNIVIFVNENEFRKSIKDILLVPKDATKPTIVSISYNTDLLAMENILPLTRRWIEFAEKNKNLNIEIRTKSALISSIKDMRPIENVILSWTLSPQTICDLYEHKAPPLKSRLRAVKYAADLGWKIRLCFDPVIFIDNWYEIYSEFISIVFNEIEADKVDDITLGVFRMNKDFFNRIRGRDPKSDIYFKDYVIEGKTVVESKIKRIEGLKMLTNILLKHVPKKNILVWN